MSVNFTFLLFTGLDKEFTTLNTFPNPVKEAERFRRWVYAIGGDILGFDNKFIYKYKKVCHKHFDKRFHTWTNTLIRDAIPTLNLPGKYDYCIRTTFICRYMVVTHTVCPRMWQYAGDRRKTYVWWCCNSARSYFINLPSMWSASLPFLVSCEPVHNQHAYSM